MKRTLIVTALTLCCVIILAALNRTPRKTETGASSPQSVSHPNYIADGNPQPPLPPLPPSKLVADGNPQPPLPPLPSTQLVADGNPQPPLPPHFDAPSCVDRPGSCEATV
jgi:hypothetical protein